MGETIRVEHSKNYTTISNLAIRDKRLSFRARGLHHLLLSYPNGWRINVEHLANESEKEGKDAIATSLKELEKTGYITRTQVREKGRIVGYESVIRELPLENPPEPIGRRGKKPVSPQPAQPDTAQPDTAQPDTANPPLNKYLYKEVSKEEEGIPLINSSDRSFRVERETEVHQETLASLSTKPETLPQTDRSASGSPVPPQFNASAKCDQMFQQKELPPWRISQKEFNPGFVEDRRKQLAKSGEWKDRGEEPMMGDAKRSLMRLEKNGEEEITAAWEAYLERKEKQEKDQERSLSQVVTTSQDEQQYITPQLDADTQKKIDQMKAKYRKAG